MNNTLKIASQVIFMLIFFSCTGDNDSDNVSVIGTIKSNNIPVEGASIIVDGMHNWSTTTSADGQFQIDNIPSGQHSIKIDNGDRAGSFVQSEYSVYVDASNNRFENLIIPKPVILAVPANVGFTTLDLTWNRTDASDFYEYKLYRHNSLGLDEETGELIYVSTNRDDTVFTDEDLISSKEYYYRVFVKNQYSQLGGSNIVGAKTLTGNLIPSGDFEDLGIFQSDWSLSHTQGTLIATIVDSVFKEGSGSLYIRNDSAGVRGNINTYTDIVLNDMITLGTNKTYEISGWLMAKGQLGSAGSVWVLVLQGNDWVALLDLGSTRDEWVYKSKTFTITKNEPVSIYIVAAYEHGWVDGVKLLPVE